MGSKIYYGEELYTDLDNNGKVDRADEKLLLEFIGVKKGDLDQNGVIDMLDFVKFSDYINGVGNISITENYLMDMDFNGDAWDVPADSKDFELFMAEFEVVKGDINADNSLTEADLWGFAETLGASENYGAYIKTAETFTAVMDMDSDGKVDSADEKILLDLMGIKKGDFDRNGVIDTLDFGAFSEYVNDVTNAENYLLDMDFNGKIDSEDEKILFEMIGFKKGDLNQNGVIDMLDFIVFSDYMNGVAEVTFAEKSLMDLDFNGVIEEADFELFMADFEVVKGDINADNSLTELDLWTLEESLSVGEKYIYYFGSYIKTETTFITIMDVDGDGWVNSADCEEMRAAIGLIKGDVNLDKVVDAADLALLLEYLRGNVTFSDTQKYCADMDGSSTYSRGLSANLIDWGLLNQMLAA
jgi:hypothetical protein